MVISITPYAVIRIEGMHAIRIEVPRVLTKTRMCVLTKTRMRALTKTRMRVLTKTQSETTFLYYAMAIYVSWPLMIACGCGLTTTVRYTKKLPNRSDRHCVIVAFGNLAISLPH